jgi:RluA family pseudouridine synthase
MPLTSNDLIANISCYLFANLSDLKTLKEKLIAHCKENSLKGTILLSTEGINLFIAGLPNNVASLVLLLQQIPGLEGLAPKYSYSKEQPFSRMLVRIKKEIIAFGIETIQPAQYSSPRVSAKELKQWLDEKRDIILYDTRNDYEIKLGTFCNAIPAKINHFRDFPNSVSQLPTELKNKTIVTFCTGGIRCEKAAPYMEQQGFNNVFQLEGGILKYFEEVGSDHYQGECFVFDQRVGVDPALAESNSSQCFVCQTPLLPSDLEDPRYQESVSCPYCFQSDEEKIKKQLIKRQQQWDQYTQNLPGCTPYLNKRPISISPKAHRLPLLEALTTLLPQVDPTVWIKAAQNQYLVDGKDKPIELTQLMNAGNRVWHKQPATLEPPIAKNLTFIYEDEAIVVIEKPAPLPMHPGGRYNRNTIQYLFDQIFFPYLLKPVHRLDANTTGLVLFAKTRQIARQLQQQFINHQIHKKYLVKISQNPAQDEFECLAPISELPSIAGTREICPEGNSAHTRFKVIARLANQTTLLEASPVTGRTHQIRIHLQHLGYTIQNDPTYIENNQTTNIQTLSLEQSPMNLHAHELNLQHPLSQKPLYFKSAIPNWANQ